MLAEEPQTMRVVGYTKNGPIEAPGALQDAEIARPNAPQGRDLLVAVKAVSVNPLDTKRRRGFDPAGRLTVLGYDAAGVVAAVGDGVSDFAVGDAVFYAGTVTRQGSYAEYQLVDERLVARKPSGLDFAEAAALPLTSLAAYELLFDRLGARRHPAVDRRTLLVIGGAGGVGSMAIQIARALTDLVVIATASRPASHDWCLGLGASHTIDHTKPLKPQLQDLGVPTVDLVMALAQTPAHQSEFPDIVTPQGSIGILDDAEPVLVNALKPKSIALHMHSMMTRPVFSTADMAEQGRILATIAGLVERDAVRTTLRSRRTPIDAATLIAAHRDVEAGSSLGKIVLEGF